MEITYKKRHYSEQLKRPKPKRCKARVKATDNWSFYERLYNQPFRVAERLARERARERAKTIEQNNRFKKQFIHLHKTLEKMKNQTINTASTLTAENFKANLTTILGSESINLIEQLDWSEFDATNKETRSATFKAMLLAQPETAAKLDELEEAKTKAAKAEAKEKAQRYENMAKELAKATNDAERLAILAKYNMM